MTVKKKAGETDITHGGKDEIMNGSNEKNISVKAAAVICVVCIAAASAVTWGISAKTGSDPGSPIDKIDISDGTDSTGDNTCNCFAGMPWRGTFTEYSKKNSNYSGNHPEVCAAS